MHRDAIETHRLPDCPVSSQTQIARYNGVENGTISLPTHPRRPSGRVVGLSGLITRGFAHQSVRLARQGFKM